MGRRARERVVSELDWRPQAEAYVSVLDEVSGFSLPGPAVPSNGMDGLDDPQGRRYVDPDDGEEFDRYLVERRAQ
jgi:hypothetical protein